MKNIKRRELKGAGELRRKAEERLKPKQAVPEKMSELETQELMQELRVHQIELEMQNEELRRTQAVLEESKAKYSDLYDFAPVGYLTLNRQGLILEANLTACSKLGEERSLLISTKALFTKFIIKKEGKGLFQKHLGKVFEAKSLETCELELNGKGNTKFYAQLQSTVVEGNLSQCRTGITDITERKRAEESLREALKQLEVQKKALDQFAIVAETDAQGRITYANDQFCRISKYSPEELIGKDHREVVNSGHHTKEFWREMWATIGSNKIWRGDIKNRAKDGEIYWVDTTIVPFIRPDGKPERYLAIRTVITERKRSEESLKQANIRLEELSGRKDDFVAHVSHELRTPLTGIKEGVNLVRDGTLGTVNAQQKEFLGIADQCVDRLTVLIGDMLDLSKIEAGARRLHRRAVSIQQLIGKAVDSFKAAVGRKIVRVSGADLHDVFADPDRTVQVLSNLLSNALKFTREDGVIELIIKEQNGMVVVAVQDDGIGIAQEDLPKLFKKFSQVGEKKEGIRGSGLGLALCKELVELQGGTVSAASELGKGSVFTFTLPVYTSALALEKSFEELVGLAKAGHKDTVALIAFHVGSMAESRGAAGLEEAAKSIRRKISGDDVALAVEPAWVVVLAATDSDGSRSIIERICGSFQPRMEMGSAIYPTDGMGVHGLLEKATSRCRR